MVEERNGQSSFNWTSQKADKGGQTPAGLRLVTTDAHITVPSSRARFRNSPPPSPTLHPETRELPFSLWDYLREELLATDFDSHQELKWERVSNFLSIPLAIEKIIGFGFILCLDSFLYTFTILPIRFSLALFRSTVNLFSCSAAPLPPSQKADMLQALLLAVSVAILVPLTDASKIYHSIRGQDTIKLYVIFNALEVWFKYHLFLLLSSQY
ncbi:eukaryotic membrane protein family-domain-containing protein [Salix suchowensis]|nr:eukaryotic membrane protein family-domain-containing protein [Salix suchowensis]